MTLQNIINIVISGFLGLLAAYIMFSVKLKELRNQLKGFKEVQFQDIVKARIEAYPNLWSILIKYANIHFYHNLKYTEEWVKAYHDELDNCNMKYGVLFSKKVHDSFEKLREGLQIIRHKTDGNKEYANTPQFQDECKKLYDIIDDKQNKRKGLGGLLKKDLGSFQRYSISKTKIK